MLPDFFLVATSQIIDGSDGSKRNCGASGNVKKVMEGGTKSDGRHPPSGVSSVLSFTG